MHQDGPHPGSKDHHPIKQRKSDGHFLEPSEQGRCAQCTKNARLACNECKKKLHLICFPLYHGIKVETWVISFFFKKKKLFSFKFINFQYNSYLYLNLKNKSFILSYYFAYYLISSSLYYIFESSVKQ